MRYTRNLAMKLMQIPIAMASAEIYSSLVLSAGIREVFSCSKDSSKDIEIGMPLWAKGFCFICSVYNTIVDNCHKDRLLQNCCNRDLSLIFMDFPLVVIMFSSASSLKNLNTV